MTDPTEPAASAQQPWLKAQGSKYFLDWLAEQQVSLALTTYQAGKLFLFGRKPDHAISIFERTYKHCMGMWVTLSKPRHDNFHGLELNEQLERRKAEPQCGLQVIDLRTGAIAHWLRLDGALVTELYDAAVLRAVRQPMAVGFQTNEIERLLTIGPVEAL